MTKNDVIPAESDAALQRRIPASHKAALDELTALTTELGRAACLLKPELHRSLHRTHFLLGTLEMHAELKFKWPTGKASR